jgi:dipeptidyl aminopeptidase/acylaminoacyl peptidase
MTITRPRAAPYGAWPSPITAELLTTDTLGFDEVLTDRDELLWIEIRPHESGRSVVVALDMSAGSPRDLTPAPFNVRSRVYEYGGGAYVADQGVLFFVNFQDQRIYRQDPGEAPRPLTSEGKLRYGGLSIDPYRKRVLAVCEDHTETDLQPPITIAAVSYDGHKVETLVSGNDFYMAPRVSPDGSKLCWLTWNHPNMPWDGTELWVAPIAAGGVVGDATLTAGGRSESICHPQWSPDGSLYFISDRTGWWNLYRWENGHTVPVAPMEAEMGRPAYSMGHAPYSFDGARHIVGSVSKEGMSRLVRIDLRTGVVGSLDTGCTEVMEPRVFGGGIGFLGGSPTEPISVHRLDPTSGTQSVLRPASRVPLDTRFLEAPEALAFPTGDGQTSHGFFYAPRNPGFQGPDGDRPPLLVFVHGGPTSSTSTALPLGSHALQSPVYWTSRGYAVLDMNYRGSTTYGRPYREALYGRWGVVDVDDCIDGARFLINRGDVDLRRTAIRGGSAGGYTTICALTFRDFFATGAAYFGLSDLEAFHGETHKFESHYDQQLIGNWLEERRRYHDRSPIHFAHQIEAPMILLQGLDDKIVPPNQSELIVEALKKRGVPVEYVAFEGEGHGFRMAASIRRAFEAEEAWYRKVFGLGKPAG